MSGDDVPKSGGGRRDFKRQFEWAFGRGSFSRSSLDKHFSDLRKIREKVGAWGEGEIFANRNRQHPQGPDAIASALPFSNHITINGGFFIRSAQGAGYYIGHEGTHAVLGLDDAVRVDNPGSVIGKDIYPDTDANGNVIPGVVNAYRWNGVKLA